MLSRPRTKCWPLALNTVSGAKCCCWIPPRKQFYPPPPTLSHKPALSLKTKRFENKFLVVSGLSVRQIAGVFVLLCFTRHKQDWNNTLNKLSLQWALQIKKKNSCYDGIKMSFFNRLEIWNWERPPCNGLDVFWAEGRSRIHHWLGSVETGPISLFLRHRGKPVLFSTNTPP